MFQLFRRGSPSLEKNWPLSFRSLSQNERLNLTDKTCLLCKLLNNNSTIQFRNQSSWAPKVNTKKQKRKKTKKNTSKTYSDIVIVTKASSCIKKANITRLTPSDLNVLTSTDVSLNELYKIKNVIANVGGFSPQTYSNLAIEGVKFNCELVPLPSDSSSPKIISNVNKPKLRQIENVDICEEFEYERDLEAQSLAIVKNSLQPEEIEENLNLTEEIEKQPSKSIQHLKHRNMIAAKTLGAYIEVCNHLRRPQKGLTALYFHQNRSRKEVQNRVSSMKSLSVYYTLLKGFADKGDYYKIQHVLDIMEAEKIRLNLNCYVAILECLGRINVDNFYLKDIRIYIKQALNQGISFDDIMNKGIFLNDEREHVLQALNAYDPDYTPTYNKPTIWYNNCLLNHLNNESQQTFEIAESKGYGELITQSAMEDLVQKQVELEEKGYITIKSIFNNDPPSKDIIHFRSALSDHYKMWAEAAHQAFHRDLATLTAQRNAFNMEPYFRSIPVKDFVEIMVQESTKMAQGSESYSPEVVILYKMLGMKVYTRYMVLKKQKTGVTKKVLTIHSKYCQNYSATHTEMEKVPTRENLTNPRIQWQLLEHSHCHEGATLKMGHLPWVPSTLTSIGKFLYHIIMHDFKIDVNSLRPNCKHQNLLPAFYTIFRSQGRIVKEEIKPHPVLSKLYKSSRPETLTFPVNEVPMSCPPVPWTAIDNGGYIIAPTDVVRLPFQASTQKKRMSDAEPAQLYPNFDALNQLATVPWKVNTKILDVILEVFRNGGSAKLDVPEDPSSLGPPPTVTAEMEKAERYQVFKQKLQHTRKKGEMYSMWCDCLYRLCLANHFRDDIFWLPHNMDFRGRVYPVPPHLNHLGSDLARSILVFAEARPLGPQGLDWLKIHLINLTGLKKRDSVQDRLDYANELLHLILDSADQPLTGQKWWAESDEPWQTLACCIEIADVIRSGMDPSEYMSHFPVHQDGSCNGLQHYAALGRDSAGAYSVNLAPSDTPQDVYSAVVNLVEERRAIDETEGVEIAKILNGFIKRKVIKQTIMTTVYGVTRFGARLQIAKQLKDIDDFPKDYVWAASSYLTGCTFESLRTMFTSTREIQDWFTECARLISGTGGHLVEWVTPMGLPVVQPYIKYKKPSMPSGYEGFPLDQFERPNVMKQKNAFPPNFIHSLDSSHMMLTSLHCERAGITFVSVHDCYWTHPSTIHIMNKICREQFVALHSQPILENLSVYLYDLYAYDEKNINCDGSSLELSKKKLNKIMRQLPKKGDFNIKKVLNSVYFFS